jgi:hypothetical protein
MSLFGLCDDPILKRLREVFRASVLKVPEERVVPLGAVAFSGKISCYLGQLKSLLHPDTPLEVDDADFYTSEMAGLAGKYTQSTSLDLGMKILEGFLQGFGVGAVALDAAFQGAQEVSFTFAGVQRKFIDISRLGELLTDKRINPGQPAAAVFFGNKPYHLLVIDSVIQSNRFLMRVDKTAGAEIHLDVSAVEKRLGQGKGKLTLAKTSDKEISFQGEKHLTFAFTCVQFYLDANGRIDKIDPVVKEIFLSRRDATGYDIVYSPDRSKLYDLPGLVVWD